MSAALDDAPRVPWPAEDRPAERPVVRARSTTVLELDDPRYGEVEVRVRNLTFREMTDPERSGPAQPADDASEADWQRYTAATAEFMLPYIASWNLTDDAGQPIAVSFDALFDLDYGAVTAMIRAWVRANRGHITGPLPSASTDGPSSVEASIPMEPLSENPPSSSTPS